MTFEVADVLTAPVPDADFALLVGVIEYYADLPGLLSRILPHVRRGVIIADTRGPLWRRTIRYALARFKHFHLYYRSPDTVAAALRQGGFSERERHLGHSFSVLCFTRQAPATGGAR